MMRKLLITGAAVVILGGAVAGWGRAWGAAAKQPEAKPALPPATAKVTKTTLVDTRTLPGTLGYGVPVPISATGTGTLTWIAPVGSIVKLGEPLFKVDERPVVVLYGSVPLYRTLQPGTVLAQTVPTPLQQRVEQAESSLRQARLRLKQLKQGPRPEEIAQAQAAESSVSQAQAAVDAAQATDRSAQAALALKKAPPSELEVAQAEEQVRQAEIALREARTALKDGVKGADVQQLEKNLAELGYTGFTVDDTYTLATAGAVRKWQADLGLPETGIVVPGQVVFTPGPVRIAEHMARVGDTSGGSSDAPVAAGSAGSPEPGASRRGVPVLSYTGTTKLVTVQLGVADQALAVVGGKATVRVPGRPAVEGKISQVSNVLTAASTATAPGGPSSAASSARIKVDVAIADQEALGSVDGAPVDVDFVVEERKDVLAVPVAALLALAEGGYGVEVVDGETTRIVPVRTGLFAAGRVEVSGKGIAEGVTVGVPK